jgi:DNA repair protein RecN (Recombination protein N)
LLEQLRIENFALVEKACLDFHPGLNIMTGETGAGKSLIVDALGLLLGERASAQYIRTGAHRAVVEGYFTYEHEEVAQMLGELGLEPSPDNSMLLTREITNNGKNYCRINGKIVPLNMFQMVGRLLVDIHGQNEQLSLLLPEKQLHMLDLRGGAQLLGVLEQVKKLYGQLQKIQEELNALQGDPVEREKMISYYQFQLAEIEQAELRDGEEEELLQRKKILQNSEKLLTGTSQAYELLFKGMSQVSAYDQLSQGIAVLEQLVAIDDRFNDTISLSNSCLYQLEEIARQLQDYLSNADFDSNELEKVLERLELLGRLKRKYGATIKNILDYQAEIRQNLEDLEQQEGTTSLLYQQKAELEQEYYQVAQELSALRRQAAAILDEEIQISLGQLDMPAVNFECRIASNSKISASGLDELEFYISPNLGEPPKPLAKIASGGEMARVMLALKAILAQVDSVETMVFDEADSGIGGLTALKVGQKLVQISQSRQVLCITHSPQIASFGDCHFLLYKDSDGKRTVTNIKRIEGQEKVAELARMLGGRSDDSTAVKHAERLIEEATQEKCV